MDEGFQVAGFAACRFAHALCYDFDSAMLRCEEREDTVRFGVIPSSYNERMCSVET